MHHYDFEKWIDFARGVAPDALRKSMEEHLKTGCQECSGEFATWKTFYAFSNGESRFEPPRDLVQSVKLAFAPRSTPATHSRAREFAKLIFDSFAQPQLQGVRSTSTTHRQLVYRAGSLMIDMSLRPLENSSRRSLTGQVVDAERADTQMDAVHVHLLSGRKELAHTHTDRFGEFYLEYDPERDLQLSLEVGPTKDVFVPLDDSLWRIPFVG